MHSGKIRTLLDELNQLAQQQFDADKQQRIQDLDIDINQLLLLEAELPEQELLEEITEQARSIEASFASEHPIAQRLVQEIIYILAQIGI